ncbi:MAG: hypothetical protein QM756_07245 [Polyangiaceae bacterium]
MSWFSNGRGVGLGVGILVAAGCSTSSSTPSSGSGGSATHGGAGGAAGGGPSGSGGTTNSAAGGGTNGGSPGAGGAAGNASSAGGNAGSAATGGTTPSGGAASGGSTSAGSANGGSTNGGSANGGSTSAGTSAGTTSGGATSGGTANGGTTSGGVASGGSAGSSAVAKCAGGASDGRYMECLDRGVVAVTSAKGAFVSWRLFGTDPADISFNLYRQLGTAAATRVCTCAAGAGTWCTDTSPTAGATYFVRAVQSGVEGAASGSATLLPQDYLRIPLRAASTDAFVHLAWVGDLDGDGEYDFVVDRISAQAPVVDAYTRGGKFLFRLDTGPLGADQDNIEGGATTISNGHWDGLTVYDFDGDGRAEIAIKTANGFVFGNGTKLSHTNDQDQFVSIVSGTTGAELARAPLPGDFKADGPLQCHFGVGYFDGVRPSVVTKCKNRIGSGAFQLVATTYDFKGTTLTQRWKYIRSGNGSDYHQIRVQDVDGDGKDELCDGGYVIDDNGKLLYSLGDAGVVHGDRFHITDMDPARPGLEGWGIQQDNANGLETYFYDAKTGQVLRKYNAPTAPGADMGRGTVADLFPDQPGYEYWSFNGMYSASSGSLVVAETSENVPWPNFLMQWDGDVGSELLDNNKVGDWDLNARSRNTYSWRRSFEGLVQARGAIPFYGDVFGDWREEALLETGDHAELRIYTTTYETDTRLYTFAHNPAYRNHLAVHGYKQSHLVDYFLGFGMATPPTPKIRLVNRP